MKACLLAAGLGTRLHPITCTTPKCLIPISDRPLMAWWFELFKKHGITDVLVNLHYLPEQVRSFINESKTAFPEIQIYEAYEKELLGSGGTIAANKGFIGNDDSFLICYADNLTNANLTELMEFHQTHNGILSMALFHTNTPEQCGIACLDNAGCIVAFEEKPMIPKSSLANAGIYIVRRELLDYLPKNCICDFGKDILPKLTGQMYGFELRDYLIDIGTHENLKKARMEWSNGNI